MKIIAHRGFSDKYPENTLIAFKKAIELGVYGIEADIRLSSDNKAIIFHDDNLKRITGIDKKPESLSLFELKKLDAGQGENIPSLDELITLTNAKAVLILEIKYNFATYKNLCEVIEKEIMDKLDWIEISCFEDKVLEYMHGINNQIKLHKLIDSDTTLIDKDFAKKYDYVSYFDIDVKLRKLVLDLSLFKNNKVIFWTVDKEDLSKEIKAGLYGVMKNNPQL